MINVVFKGAQGFHFLNIGKNRVIIVFNMQARSAGLCPFNYSLLHGNTRASSIIEKPRAHSLYGVKISVRFRHMERKWSEENLRWKTKTDDFGSSADFSLIIKKERKWFTVVILYYLIVGSVLSFQSYAISHDNHSTYVYRLNPSTKPSSSERRTTHYSAMRSFRLVAHCISFEFLLPIFHYTFL